MAEILWTGSIVALAGFGGFVRYIQKFTGIKADRPEWEWSVAGITFGTGAFVGYLALLAIGKKLDADYMHLAVAIAGYGGPLTLDAAWGAGRDFLTAFVNRAASGSKDGDAKG